MNRAQAGSVLLANYEAILRVTAQMRDAMHQDETDTLDVLIAEREKHVEEAERVLAQFGRGAAGEEALPEPVRTAAVAKLEEIKRLEDELRAHLASRSQQVPEQMAHIRGSWSAMGGYQRPNPDLPALFDRRG